MWCGARRLAWTAVVLVAGMWVESAGAALLSVSDRRDHVYDPVSKCLYISTESGTVQRYSTVTNTFLTPWTVGGTLRGIDVTQDGASVVVAEHKTSGPPGRIHRINTATGAVNTYTFDMNASWDVVALNNNKVIFTGSRSNWSKLHELDLTTNVVTARSDPRGLSGEFEARDNSWLIRNASGSAALGLEANISGAQAFRYTPSTDQFSASTSMSNFAQLYTFFHTDGIGSVSRDGQLLAMEVDNGGRAAIANGSLSAIVKVLTDVDGGMMFHPNRDQFFALDVDLDRVNIYDTNTWSLLRSVPAGVNLQLTSAFNNGITSFDATTDTLFVSVNGGIEAIRGVPEPSCLGLAALAMCMLWRRSR